MPKLISQYVPPPRYVVWVSNDGLKWLKGTAGGTLARARQCVIGYRRLDMLAVITRESHTPIAARSPSASND